MQPETKEPVNAKEPTPAEQWDAVAFKLIQQELAPKGFSEIKRGLWRGKVQSNIPFLPKTSVVNCQKIAAQMVRTFRGKAGKVMENYLKQVDGWTSDNQAELKSCRFWQFKKKAELKGNIRSLLGQSAAWRRMIYELDKLGIK